MRCILGHSIRNFFTQFDMTKLLIHVFELFHLVIIGFFFFFFFFNFDRAIKGPSKVPRFALRLSVDHDSTDRTRPGGSYTLMYLSKWHRWYFSTPLKNLKQEIIPFFTPEASFNLAARVVLAL